MGHAELLRRNRELPAAVPGDARLAARTWLATIALTVDVYDRTHSGSWVSALLIAVFLPTVIVGVAVGPLLDRLSRRNLMIASDLLRAGVFVALPFVDRPVWIVALAGRQRARQRRLPAGRQRRDAEPARGGRAREGQRALHDRGEHGVGGGPLVGGVIVAMSGHARGVLDQRGVVRVLRAADPC